MKQMILLKLLWKKPYKENPDVIATGSLSGWIDQIKKIFTVCKVIKPELITNGGMLSGEPDLNENN